MVDDVVAGESKKMYVAIPFSTVDEAPPLDVETAKEVCVAAPDVVLCPIQVAPLYSLKAGNKSVFPPKLITTVTNTLLELDDGVIDVFREVNSVKAVAFTVCKVVLKVLTTCFIAPTEAALQVGAAPEPPEVRIWPLVPYDGDEPTPNAPLVFRVIAAVEPFVCNVKELALLTIGVVTDVVPLNVVNVPAAAAVPPMAGGLAK